MKNIARELVTFAAGLLFAVGLGVAGMTQPAKVVGFLDFTGAWDPSLAFVMGGAVAVHFVLFRLILRRGGALFGERMQLPSRRDIDPPLLVGSALFGVGWGLGGYCPGPGLTSLGSGSSSALVFVIAMVVGMAANEALQLGRSRPAREAGPRRSAA